MNQNCILQRTLGVIKNLDTLKNDSSVRVKKVAEKLKGEVESNRRTVLEEELSMLKMCLEKIELGLSEATVLVQHSRSLLYEDAKRPRKKLPLNRLSLKLDDCHWIFFYLRTFSSTHFLIVYFFEIVSKETTNYHNKICWQQNFKMILYIWIWPIILLSTIVQYRPLHIRDV